MEQLPQVRFYEIIRIIWKKIMVILRRSRRSYWYMAPGHLILMVPAVCVQIINPFYSFIYSGR